MKELVERIENIAEYAKDEEVANKYEYILYELRLIFKDEEVVKKIYDEILEML